MVGASQQPHSNPPVLSRPAIYSRQLALIGLISLVTLGAGWFGLSLLERRLVTMSGENIAVLAADIASKLDLIVAERYGDIRVLGHVVGLQANSSISFRHKIATMKQIFPSYLWIGIMDSTGRVVEATDPSTVGMDLHNFEGFQAVKQTKSVHVGDVRTHITTFGTDAVSFTAPIGTSVQEAAHAPFAGAVSSRIGIAKLETLVTETIRTFQRRHAFFQSIEYQVLRDDGTVFIDSDLWHKSKDTTNLRAMGLPSALLSRTSPVGFVEETHLRRHTAVVTGYARTRGYGEFSGLGWIALVRVDRADVLAPIRSFTWAVGTLGLLVVGPLVALLVRATGQARAGWVEAEMERARSRDNERRLRSILESEPEGILVIGHDHRVLQINPAGCALFDAGFLEEIIGHSVMDFVHNNDRRLIEQAYETARVGRESCGRGRFIGLSGQTRWIEMTSVPLFADDGAVQSVLSVVRDVTEQKRADRRQALQHAVAKVLAEASTAEQAVPELLRAIGVSLEWHVGFFWKVQEDRQAMICVQDWSNAASPVQEFLRTSRRDSFATGLGLPGRCWASGEPLWVSDVSTDPGLKREAAADASRLHSGCAFPIWLRTDVFGVMEFFSQEVHPHDADLLRTLATVGSQIGLFIERAEVEAALHENEARTSLIIDTALDAVMTMDRTGRITEWNAQAEQVFGWSAHEVIGREAADTIFPPSHCLSYREYVQRLLEPRDALLSNRLIEMVGLRRDGHEFPIEIAMTPLAVEGSVIFFSAFIRDITSRKEAEQAQKNYARQLEHINQQLDAALREAKAATEAKSSFLATMSHEIRTPMNGVIGMTGLLLETTLTEEQREYAETVHSCGDHLLTIINDILDFSKIEAGKLDLEMIEFDLRLAIDESLDLVAERASSKGLNLACLFHADVPRNLLGDPGRLRQVVTNLTANAIKFTERGDVVVEVTVEAQSKDDAMIRIAVSDTGIGISEQARERLFQSFSQADGSTTRKYGGTGLGLAICKRLVEMMGGTIGVMSRIGEGSRFWFTMNLRKQADGSRHADPPAAVLAGLRILIVDEKAINRRILELMTKKWGMQPTLIHSGSEALDVLSGRHGQPRFDLALLDVDMSPTDGIELAREIQARDGGGETKLVLLTSFGRRGDAKTAKEAGLAAYLTKPVRERQLHDCLVAVITQRPVVSGMPATRESPPLITRHTLAETKAKVDLRILLAEDNIINQKVAVRLFQRLGYRIDVVVNGREAVEAVARVRYDVVFMDCQMPDMDGFEATQAIRQHEAQNEIQTTSDYPRGRPRVLIIAMTANAMQGDRERCLAAGMDEYLAKPISKDALAQVLGRVNQEHECSRPDKSQEAA